MGTRYLLDSNTVIDYIAQLHPDAGRRWLDEIIDEEINVSVITKIEVLSFAPDKTDNYAILLDFFDSSRVFALDADIERKTIQIRQNQKIKLPDAIIAATSLVHGLSLITRNTADFKNIADLKTIDPHSL